MTSYELSPEEKISIVEQHIRNLEYSKYNLETTLLAEQALTSPDSAAIISIQNKLTEVNTKKAALTTELSNLQALVGE